MGIPVKLDVFEGPLDLLLHLIDKNKVNIYDIPIFLITEQYMEYIQKMKIKDMDIMSEFLVMAATLVHIKSKMLLPRDEKLEEEGEDPRKELVERLLEYKMYQYMSYELKDKQLDAKKVLFKRATIPGEVADYKEEVNLENLLSGLTLAKLHAIFQSIIKKQVDKIDPIRSKFNKIEKEEIHLGDKMEWIERFAAKHTYFYFSTLIQNQQNKMDIIVTFLGVLELMKTGKLMVVQDNTFDDMIITYRDRGNLIGDKTIESND